VVATIFLAEKLCEPVGGILTHPVNYTGSTTGKTTTSPSPAVFTGAGARARAGAGAGVGLGVGGLGIVAGVLMVV